MAENGDDGCQSGEGHRAGIKFLDHPFNVHIAQEGDRQWSLEEDRLKASLLKIWMD